MPAAHVALGLMSFIFHGLNLYEAHFWSIFILIQVTMRDNLRNFGWSLVWFAKRSDDAWTLTANSEECLCWHHDISSPWPHSGPGPSQFNALIQYYLVSQKQHSIYFHLATFVWCLKLSHGCINDVALHHNLQCSMGVWDETMKSLEQCHVGCIW